QAGLERCQREAEEVAELMKQNFARALERDGRLQDLDSRAQELRSMVSTYSLGDSLGTHSHRGQRGDTQTQ
ncbi:VAMP5 protein, partial [Thinocorus orbignyianus]|nr:VAMP5 protein [Thinocorus orbignyianus]